MVIGHAMTAICGVLGIARHTAYYVARARPDGRDHRAADPAVLRQSRAVTSSRATCGYRRVWAIVNRTFRTGYNRKRIRRVMQRHGLMLAPRVHRRHGRPHLGQIHQPASNQHWCSDVFLITCWSGEVISVALSRPTGTGPRCRCRKTGGARRRRRSSGRRVGFSEPTGHGQAA